MRIIQAREKGERFGFEAEERRGYTPLVFDNVVTQMRALVKAMSNAKRELSTEAAKVRSVPSMTAYDMSRRAGGGGQAGRGR